jgi:4-hydroxy-tetrahydrodipicolinate reductase
MRLAEIAAPHFPVAEVIELHHDTKVDAPSGTALATAQRIGAAAPDQARKVEGVSSPPGALGADVANVRVHSVRLPGLVAHQEVLFGGAGGETLSIRYDTYDGAAYMPGVLLAIRRVASLEAPVTVGLQGLLGI